MHFFTYANEKICRVCETTEHLISLALDSNKNVLKKLRACADVSVRFQRFSSIFFRGYRFANICVYFIFYLSL